MKGHKAHHEHEHHDEHGHGPHHEVHMHVHKKHGGKARKKRETGGRNDAEADLAMKPEARTNATNIDREAEEKKKGGRAKRAHGGHVHHEQMHMMKHAKHVGHVHGESHHHAGRKPRKSGGRTGSDSSPFTSARHGTAPAGRKEEMEFE